jgi:hypothetical protein
MKLAPLMTPTAAAFRGRPGWQKPTGALGRTIYHQCPAMGADLHRKQAMSLHQLWDGAEPFAAL